MNLRDKSDKEQITSDLNFEKINLDHISNDVPHGDEVDRLFKFSTLTVYERFILVLRKLDYLQDKVDSLISENRELKNTIEEMKRKEFWKK